MASVVDVLNNSAVLVNVVKAELDQQQNLATFAALLIMAMTEN